MLAGAVSGLMDEDKVEAALESASDQIHPQLDAAGRQAKLRAWNSAVESVIDSAK
jgi:hypothetical protein